jgi:hypothetical protein
MPPSRVLLVANRTATDEPRIAAVRDRARRGAATFHLVVPATPQGLHRVVDPEDTGIEEARRRLEAALPWRLSRWMRIDLPSKVRALGLPVLHVSARDRADRPAEAA